MGRMTNGAFVQTQNQDDPIPEDSPQLVHDMMEMSQTIEAIKGRLYSSLLSHFYSAHNVILAWQMLAAKNIRIISEEDMVAMREVDEAIHVSLINLMNNFIIMELELSRPGFKEMSVEERMPIVNARCNEFMMDTKNMLERQYGKGALG